MSWIVVTEITVPPGVETWASAEPIKHVRLTQFQYDNGLQEARFENTSTGFNMISTFYDEVAHTNLMNALATNLDWLDRNDYNQTHGITQRNVYSGLNEGYDQSKYL
jgi:hypothetical protein